MSESLRVASLSQLDNLVNNKSAVNTDVLDSLQKVRYFFISTTLLVHTTLPTISTKHPFLTSVLFVTNIVLI